MLLMHEKVMYKARLVRVPLIRYSDRIMDAMMVMVYFPALARCGKMLPVSL